MASKFAIGCLVQWYEVEILKEYLKTLRNAIDNYEGEVIVDILLSTNEDLERCQSLDLKAYCEDTVRYTTNKYGFTVNYTQDLCTIADYRRMFNDKYCTEVDVLIWGETDMLVPKELFTTLDLLHTNVETPKYIATFGICKMWDDSWKPLEHPEFTDKPFIPNDYENWWSLKYTMAEDEMNAFNEKVENLDIQVLNKHKFNGCGLVISSEVIKAGVNIPQSVFFVHEDTAFMLMLSKILPGTPQYIIKNILLVHNRNHPSKRMYVEGESGTTMNEKRRSNDWYVKANKFSEENCYNLFNPMHKAKTWTDVWK